MLVTFNLSVTASFCNQFNLVHNIIEDEKKTISSNDHKRELFAKLRQRNFPSFLSINEGKSFLISLNFTDVNNLQNLAA